MDNGQMARWVARVEHFEKLQAEKRNELFWRDIRPDDPVMGVSHTTVSHQVQPTSSVSFLTRSLESLRARLGSKRKSELTHAKAGYKQS